MSMSIIRYEIIVVIIKSRKTVSDIYFTPKAETALSERVSVQKCFFPGMRTPRTCLLTPSGNRPEVYSQ